MVRMVLLSYRTPNMPSYRLKIALLSMKRGAFDGIEGQTAARVFRRLAWEGDRESLDLFEVSAGHPLRVRDVCANGDYDTLIFVRGTVFITRESIDLMAGIAVERDDLMAIAPVTNLSHFPCQVQPPPSVYHTISSFRWVVSEIQDRYQRSVTPVLEIDDFCFAIRAERIAPFPQETPLTRVSAMIRDAGSKYGVARGVYVHRYGDLYESAREDLMTHVPLDARDILDIGCAHGLFGKTLKDRQGCTVVGVEWDSELARVAGQRLDAVMNQGIEEVVDRGDLGQYDCIVCGDVLEHLYNPWKIVSELKRHLKKGGRFVASVPNIANWGILYEMLKGRWDYVPFTPLSGTHVRFFTRETLRECFEDAGYRIEHLYFQDFGVPPQGTAFLNMLKRGFGSIHEEELKASEIVIVAARD